MQLVEQHLIRKSDPRYGAVDRTAFASKNLYNQATYQMRQAFIKEFPHAFPNSFGQGIAAPAVVPRQLAV